MTKVGIALRGIGAAASTSRRLRSIFLEKIDCSTLSFDSEALEGRLSTGRIPSFDPRRNIQQFDIRLG